ncbi:hypothetical protein [Alkanindiges illinoisensis]|uniref:hypothetical protein n=1 Tax=Alkanindiges illinoisensis TaxID=197183 RepID=UPI00047EDF8D|nr:hypothetical protein [Alkanindiges illinoisensis]
MNSKAIRGFNQTSLMVLSIMGGAMVTGCTSMPNKASLSPQQAVISGYQQLYSTPSYQFSGQFKINQFGFNRDPKILQAAAELEKQKKAKEKQQLLQRYIDELTADAQSEYADDADTALDKKTLTASQQEAIRQQAEQEVNELYADEAEAAVEARSTKNQDATKPDNTEHDNLEDDSTQAQDENETATSRLSRLNKDKLIEDLIYTYAKRYRINYQGTLDLRHGQIALSPEMRYEASNMAGYVRVPLVLDVRQAHLYVDLSALSPWLVQVQNDGKYSRVDLSPYKNKADFKQLFEVLKQTTQASYQLPKAQQFRDISLTATEKKQGAVRKVEFSQPVAHRIADVATFLSLNQNSLKQIIKTKAADTDQANNQQPASQQQPLQLISADAASQLMTQNPETYQHILQMVEEKIDPASTLKQVILLDSKGRMIESGALYDLVFKPSSKGQFSMQLSHQQNFANYGRAEVAFKPNASNWVDAKANMQDTLLGGLVSIFSKKSLGTDDMLKSFGEDDSADHGSAE